MQPGDLLACILWGRSVRTRDRTRNANLRGGNNMGRDSNYNGPGRRAGGLVRTYHSHRLSPSSSLASSTTSAGRSRTARRWYVSAQASPFRRPTTNRRRRPSGTTASKRGPGKGPRSSRRQQAQSEQRTGRMVRLPVVHICAISLSFRVRRKQRQKNIVSARQVRERP